MTKSHVFITIPSVIGRLIGAHCLIVAMEDGRATTPETRNWLTGYVTGVESEQVPMLLAAADSGIELPDPIFLGDMNLRHVKIPKTAEAMVMAFRQSDSERTKYYGTSFYGLKPSFDHVGLLGGIINWRLRAWETTGLILPNTPFTLARI